MIGAGTPRLWIDTNVMAEIYTQGDLHRDAPRGEEHVERRLSMLKGALWLAMALDEERATTVSFEGEGRDTITSLAPPAERIASWTSAILHIARPYVFPGWDPRRDDSDRDLPKGREGNTPRDELMVRLCKERGYDLVTRDRKGKRGQSSAYALAKAAGVRPWAPEEYAVTVLAEEAAHERFMTRLEEGALRFFATDTAGLGQRLAATRELLDRHEAIWAAPTLPVVTG